MTPEEFVEALKIHARDASVANTLKRIAAPQVRNPSAERVEMAQWYQSLNDNARRILGEVIRMAAHDAVFGALCILDGVRVVTPVETRGSFLLFHDLSGQQTRLNDPKGSDFLHDLFNAPE
ncbi:MAG: hypothetical protein U0X73_12400 [Thermoanaerobaculia bacterium]